MNNNKHKIGQLGVNPNKYSFDKFKEFDSRGREITSGEIEHIKSLLLQIYENLPSHTIYTKAMIDKWVKENTGNDLATNSDNFLVVVNIESGFFQRHKIVIRSVSLGKNNDFVVEFNATDAEGNSMESPETLQTIVQNIVLLNVYEQALIYSIKEAKLIAN